MIRSLCSISCIAVASMIASTTALASTITLLPSDIHQNDTTTAQFADGNLTLTPLIGATPATFNGADPGRLGIDDQGTNANAFNDPDTDPNNGNEEKLQFEFSATSGLTRIGWDFSRTNVAISGFTADPLASFSGNNAGLSAQYSGGILSFALPFSPAFSDSDGFLDLANPAASAGATLLLSVSDPNEAGAQLAITAIEYATGIPEPSALLLMAGGLVVAGLRRVSRHARSCGSSV